MPQRIFPIQGSNLGLQADSLLTWVTREILLYIHPPKYLYLLTILQVIIIFTTL